MSNQLLETQPRTYRPTLTSLLSLPFRICNPPPAPAVGKVRSCGVTPLLQIRLEDILNRKHLPPLGLKDFEEWLLYVEDCPENLYFILWLKEYTVKYHQWAAASKARRQTVRYLQDRAPAPSASHLSLFYARAKQTFFMPNSVYELDIPSDILAPFHTIDLSNHPDPAFFHQLSQEVTRMLEKSLERFISAQLTNVGNNRVLCGIIAGIFFILVGFIPLIVVNFIKGYSRWNRIAAFPGLWIGLSILLAALNGICLGVYIFGDLRQLRKFELERPPISKPRPLGKVFLPLFSPPSSPITLAPSTPITLVAPSPPPLAHIVENCLTRTPTISSISSCSSSGSDTSGSSGSHMRIEISGAYYETESIDDDPYYSPSGVEPTFTFNEKIEEDRSAFATTAAFIHPYDSTIDLEEDGPKFLPQERQPISPFNFDALPPRSVTGRYCSVAKSPNLDHEIVEIKSDFPPLSKVSATTILEQLQIRCIPKKWLVLSRKPLIHPATSPDDVKDLDFESARSRIERFQEPVIPGHPPRRRQSPFSIEKQFKKVRAVPAFTSLTRVLSPVVVRAQWEIVVRSSLIAFAISWVVVGSLLAIPD
ncbi:hypothetical protein C0989_012157 [Termitomyces sp. Mn162]|nr:hypothetical protein C0989_012157 [Termitomyces sp. Mn162]